MSGVLRIRKELDFEKQQFFNLTVLAEDRGVPSLRSQTFVETEVGKMHMHAHIHTHTHTEILLEHFRGCIKCQFQESSPEKI